MPDFLLTNHGSLFLLSAETPEACAWVEEHLPDERMTWGGATVIEPRYVDAVATGIVADGLTII